MKISLKTSKPWKLEPFYGNGLYTVQVQRRLMLLGFICQVQQPPDLQIPPVEPL